MCGWCASVSSVPGGWCASVSGVCVDGVLVCLVYVDGVLVCLVYVWMVC